MNKRRLRVCEILRVDSSTVEFNLIEAGRFSIAILDAASFLRCFDYFEEHRRTQNIGELILHREKKFEKVEWNLSECESSEFVERDFAI